MYCGCDIKRLCIIALFVGILLLGFILLFIGIYFNNSEEEKDILVAIAVEGDNTQVGEAIIKFSQNEIVEGTAISHEPGSDQILINEDGIYQVSYYLNGTRATIGTFNFNAALLVNNAVLFNTLNEGPILRDNVVNRMTLTGTVILRLNAGDILQLGGLSIEDISYPRARIDIEKIS